MNKARLSVRDRLRSLLDERRWRDYARSPTAIFYGNYIFDSQIIPG